MKEAFRAWLRELQEPLPPLTGGQRWMVVVVCAVAALSRFLAVSRSVWDADEARFALAVREFDVADHRPHPPGFPFFIALGRLVHLAGLGEFRSLQVVVVAFALILAPAMFFLCREARAPFATALVASAFLAFFPNVWFYGGTAFSDVPAIALVIVAIALLLRGVRSTPSLYGGAVLLGVAASIRPQSLLIGVVPFVLTMAARRWRARTALATLIVAAIVTFNYGYAAYATGWERYVEALRAHRAYIAATDSFRSAIRPPLYLLIDDFFVRPFRAPLINAAISVLMVVSFVSAVRRRRPQPLLFLLTFAPFCLMAWLTLDHFSASRFAIGYAPLMAYLAADGLHVSTRRQWRLEAAGAAALVAAMILWTWPALTEIRENPSPPVRAIESIRGASGSPVTVSVDPRLATHARLLLAGFTESDDGLPFAAPWRGGERSLLVREEITPRAGVRTFSRPHDRLWSLARQRYFDISVADSGQAVLFGEGWYGEEVRDGQVWRWMGRRAALTLPPASAPARLQLRLRLPIEALRDVPTITVRFNGAAIDSFAARAPVEVHDYTLTPRSGVASELVIETTDAAKVAGDPRDLGVRLDDVRWSWPRSELEVDRDREPGLDALPVFQRR